MPGTKAGSPARIALAILVVVALLATAVGVTIWRYDHALNDSDAAQVSTYEQYSSQRAEHGLLARARGDERVPPPP